MSVNPFDSVMRSRAAFDAGQHNTDVVNGLSGARFDTFGDGNQPPLSFGGRDQGLALKVSAPPLTLDFTTKTESQVNLAGILKHRQIQPGTLDFNTPELKELQQPAVKAPETVALKAPEAAPSAAAEVASFQKKPEAKETLVADSSTLPKRAPALTLAEFSSLGSDAQKFQNATYDLSIKHTEQGSVFKHKYTADDFSSCTLSSNESGISAVVTDSYARKQYEEHVSDGKSTVTRYTYDDSGARKAMFPSRKDIALPDGTTQSFSYDKFGKVVQA